MKHSKFLLLAAGVLTMWLEPSLVHGSMTFTTLASFNNTTTGAEPYTPPVQFVDGNLYGVTPYGGTNGVGVVYRVTTSAHMTTLHTFNGNDGGYPVAQLTPANDGNLYGTTSSGGTNNSGTIFKITTNGLLTTLYAFGATTNDLGYRLDGADPYGALTQGKDGNFYGVTYDGGVSNIGTVFQFTTNGLLTTLHSFSGNGSNDGGAYPYIAPLVEGSPGVFYGTTYEGGTNNFGTIFQITTNGDYTTLHEFDGTNGQYPYAGLSWGSNDGNLYGTTYGGGANFAGTVFRMTTNGDFTVIFQFNGTNGLYPEGGVVPGINNNLYGTTFQGGAKGYGTVFKIATNGMLTTLYSFTGQKDGANLYGGLTRNASGNLYGASPFAGSSGGYGTVFQLTDSTKPTITIAAPTTNQRWSNAVFTVSGTAKDNVAVADVFYSLNSSTWIPALTTNEWTNWTAQVILPPGTNFISAYAVDDSGNHSTTNTVKFLYVLNAPLTLGVNGYGSISPNYNNSLLQINGNYSMKATAKTGFVFANWADGFGNVLTNGATLSFVMASNLTFVANFQDVTKPTLSITAPASGQHMTNALAMVTGKASDNWQVAGVWYQLNNQNWSQPVSTNVWTNWTATVELQAATNTFKAYAVDLGGNFSTTNSVSFVSSNAFKLQLEFPSSQPMATNGLSFALDISPGLNGHILVSTNLVTWATLTNFVGTSTNLNFLDAAATNLDLRFYRAVIP